MTPITKLMKLTIVVINGLISVVVSVVLFEV
jgi:hypothetical protein